MSLGLYRNLAVKRAGRNHYAVYFRNDARDGAAAVAAELPGKTLGLWHLVLLEQGFALRKDEIRVCHEQVRRVSRAGCLAAASAMTVVEALWIACHFVIYGAAQAASLERD